MEFTIGGMTLTDAAKAVFGVQSDGVSAQSKAAMRKAGVMPDQLDKTEPVEKPVDTSGQTKGKSTKEVMQEKYGDQTARQEAEKKRLLEKQRLEAEQLGK